MFEMPNIIPDSEKIKFKPAFVERYSALTDFEEFRKYSLSFLRRSIRVNTLMIGVNELVSRIEKDWKLEKVPWCNEGFWIEGRHDGRRDIGNMLEHALGYFYVQGAASMIPPIVLGPKPGETVLDMCASPGSKASQISQYMQNTGMLVANDLTGARLASLGINLQRMGVVNCMLTFMNGLWFGKTGIKFDKVLLDAPCSGTGTIRKSLKTIQMWNPLTITKLASDQKALFRSAFACLKEGGTMVYSTCSLEPEENEGIIDWAVSEFQNLRVEEIELSIKRGKTVEEFLGKKYSPEAKKCMRIWPQDNDTEGFFIAKIRKL